MEQELMARGLTPKLMKVYNEASKLLKCTFISKISHFNGSRHIVIE
jgi:hypothetical protein